MRDKFKRKIDYMRISVTDRCNLRCVYCMPPEGVVPKSHEEILTFEEIYRVVKAAVKVGIRKIRLTGGEPLVRKGILALVEVLAKIPEIEDLALTTNGILLADMAEDLYRRGLRRVNVSLTPLTPALPELNGEASARCSRIEAALKVGFDQEIAWAWPMQLGTAGLADLTANCLCMCASSKSCPRQQCQGRQFVSSARCKLHSR